MKNVVLLAVTSILLLIHVSCKKIIITPQARNGAFFQPREFFCYTIPAGAHFSTTNPSLLTEYSQLFFSARFDSSAIYETNDPSNQEDVNKLYGFSDNAATHQDYSARFGWNWTRNALRLYAYVYDNGSRIIQEITPIGIGAEYNCSIKVFTNKYIFSVKDSSVEIPRSSHTSTAKGYKLYPYFGGDENAPHEIRIWIRE